MRGSVCAYFIVILAPFANASLLDVDFAEPVTALSQKRLAPALGIQSSSSPKAIQLASLLSGRKLMQSGDGACEWDEEAEECNVSDRSARELLEQVDSPASNYLHSLILCREAPDEAECEDLDCLWNGEFCDASPETLLEVYSADCLGEAQNIANIGVLWATCGQITDPNICEAEEQCGWTDEECVMDLWQFFYDIPTEGSLPIGFGDVSQELNDQVSAEVEAAEAEGEINSPSDILTLDISPFDCPSGTEQLVCDYVAALTPIILTTRYCNSAYPEAANQRGCERDPLCQTISDDPDVPCQPSDTVESEIGRASLEVFAAEIEDPEARQFLELVAACGSTLEESECTGDCYWNAASNECELRPGWVDEQVYRIVGDTDNPVCQLATADVTTGCIENGNENSCAAEESCTWRSVDNSCRASLHVQLEIAFEDTAVEDDYDAARDLCSGSSLDECN